MARLPQLGTRFRCERPCEREPAVLGRDLADCLGLLADVPLTQPVELEKQRREHRVRQLREPVHRIYLHIVQQLDPRDGDPELDRGDDGADGVLDTLEVTGRGGNRFRTAMQPQRQLGDHAERAFRPDEQLRQVVARGRLACPPTGFDHPAISEDDGEPQDRFSHRAVADRGGARCTRRRHAAERGVGARIEVEDQSRRAEVLLELLASDAGLDGRVEIVGADAQDVVHPRHVDRDAAVDRVDVPFERRSGTERHDRAPVRRARANDGLDRFRALGEHDRMRQRRGVVGFTAAVMLADGGGRREVRPRDCAELLDQCAEVTCVRHGVTERLAPAA